MAWLLNFESVFLDIFELSSCLTLPIMSTSASEMWPSGRRRSPAKGVGEESSRGFESLRLRHHNLIIPVLGISGAIPAQDQGFKTAVWA